MDGATAIVVSEPWELARSAARFFFATGVACVGRRRRAHKIILGPEFCFG